MAMGRIWPLEAWWIQANLESFALATIHNTAFLYTPKNTPRYFFLLTRVLWPALLLLHGFRGGLTADLQGISI